MSIQAIAWVFERSPSVGTERLVLLSIANHVDPDGENAWPKLATIAAEANCSVRVAQRAIQRLVEHGELEIHGRDPTSRADRAGRKFRMAQFNIWRRGDAGDTPQRKPTTQPGITDEIIAAMERGDAYDTPRLERGDAESIDGVTPVVRRGDAGGAGLPRDIKERVRRRSVPNRPEPSERSAPVRRKRSIGDPAPHGFDKFWEVWGRREAKLEAMRAWEEQGLHLNQQLAARVVSAVEEQERRGMLDWTTRDPRTKRLLVPHPATWLRGQRWEDEPPRSKAEKPLPPEHRAQLDALRRESEQLRLEMSRHGTGGVSPEAQQKVTAIVSSIKTKIPDTPTRNAAEEVERLKLWDRDRTR
jgi:hypothetical protein